MRPVMADAHRDHSPNEGFPLTEPCCFVNRRACRVARMQSTRTLVWTSNDTVHGRGSSFPASLCFPKGFANLLSTGILSGVRCNLEGEHPVSSGTFIRLRCEWPLQARPMGGNEFSCLPVVGRFNCRQQTPLTAQV